ncbi:MAG: lipopolysaccharide heptosyltransferase family protein [Gammaproteobacteria bacterium]|nr:MAG: lipopolysaccharide heptosyltransferase family protein [Gammaproteobacteria bacterium]
MNILVIRRDNIGDLICTLPMLRQIRLQYPQARLHVLVNSYNAPVLHGLDYIDQVHVYTKAKHREPGQSLPGVYWHKLMTFLRLRRARLDIAIAASGGFNKRAVAFARQAGARRIVSFAPDQGAVPAYLTDPVAPPPLHTHEAERMRLLLSTLGPLPAQLPPPRVQVMEDERQALLNRYPELNAGQPVIGCHLSARRPANRWTQAKWVALIHRLADRGFKVALFWSPGASDDPRHPGDDELAQAIVGATPAEAVIPVHTTHLRALMAGQACCQALVLSDGGHMHLAAAQGKPLVAFFGDTDSQRWHPVGTEYTLLQPPNGQVSEIDVDEVEQALVSLLDRTASPS